MIDKLKDILKNYSSLSEQMASPNIINNVAEYSRLAKEHRKMSETVTLAKEYIKIYAQIQDDEEILEGEGLPTNIIPQDEILNWGERVPYRIMVPRGREHVADEILRKL